MNDPIVEEIRKYRERYAAKFNYELAAICLPGIPNSWDAPCP